jgi:MYXO-CTERM domain-containing protein
MSYRVILAGVLFSSAASASTYHVATTGSDSAAGTHTAPFKTIQRAADAVAAGDTVVIHAGTYTGFVVDATGTAAAPVAFKGDGTVNINGSATTDRDAVHIEGASYVIVEGLTVTGATRAGMSALDSHHITFRKNKVDQNGRWGIFSSHVADFTVEDNEVSRSGTEHGIYASNEADRPIIRRNVIWGNKMCGVHMNGDINFGGDGVISNALVENNVITNNGSGGGSGINGDGVANAVIRNNVLDGNHASGISLYQIDGGAPSTNNLVINNTIRMASDARWAVNIQDGSTGNKLRNNILLHPNTSRGAVDICSSCLTGFLSDHNALVGRFSIDGTMTTLSAWRTRTGSDGASFTATDAQLFGAATNMTLAAGSPAIDAGDATGAPTTDILGVSRPQGNGIDIGAYELCTGNCTGTTPPGGGDDPTGGDGDGSGSDDGSDDGSGSGDSTGDDGDNYSGPVVEEPGDGGCSAGGTPGWLLVLGVVAVLVGARKRRRR